MPPKKTFCQILHEGRESGPCAFCGEHKPRYWHIAQATPKNASTVILLKQNNIAENDCICYACKLKVRQDRHDRVTNLQPPKENLQTPVKSQIVKVMKRFTKPQNYWRDQIYKNYLILVKGLQLNCVVVHQVLNDFVKNHLEQTDLETNENNQLLPVIFFAIKRCFLRVVKIFLIKLFKQKMMFYVGLCFAKILYSVYTIIL